MTYVRTCDVCHSGYSGRDRAPNEKRIPQRYSIRRYLTLEPGEKPQNANNVYQGRFVSAGSIDLCDPCWEMICKPRMRPQRKPKASRNQYTRDEPSSTQRER